MNRVEAALTAVFVLLLSACSVSSEDRAGGIGDGSIPGTDADRPESGPSAPSSGGDASSGSGGASAGFPPAPGADPAPTPGGNPNPITPGTLTVGTWDDNRNFDFFLGYRRSIVDAQIPGLLPLTDADHRAANDRFSQPPGPKQTLDVSFVIDTTGSMGDEIRYLQTEFIALSSSIFQRYPNAEQRWSLVLYRDTGDTYVVRWFDFRDDPGEFQVRLGEQSADGGGDTPEAPEQALAKTSELAWRTGDDTARLAFWVADAPHHAANAGALADAVGALQGLDVHVYPVASSGIDELTELSMRQTAQLTGGRYLFLTDDSGVGGVHKEPTVPCYFVTKLDDAIVRMIEIELSGEYREPASTEIIRTGGDPRDGACTLVSGDQVLAF